LAFAGTKILIIVNNQTEEGMKLLHDETACLKGKSLIECLQALLNLWDNYDRRASPSLAQTKENFRKNP